MLEVERCFSSDYEKIEMPKISKILLVLRNDVDYTETVNHLINLATPEQKVYILYVANIEPLLLHEKIERKIYGKLRKEGKRIVDEAIKKLEKAGINAELYDMHFGIAAERILKAEKELEPDLIVMGARGLSTFKKILMGSVSDAVLKKTTKPVVIIKSRED